MFGREKKKTLDQFGDLFMPEEAAEPILSKPVRGALLEWLTEIWAEDELTAVGIKPRRRAIFDGAPGVGKTTLAHHLSARLGLPMLAVRPERVISKWVGETGANLGELFDGAAHGLALPNGTTSPVVLFLDEFDALSRQRRRGEQASDDSRNEEVNTLLQRLEQHPGFVIAATNFGEHIDQAIWRRFDMHITLALPGPVERERILARYFAPYGLPTGALKALAESLETASPALMRALAENIKRQIVIGPKLGSDMGRDAVIERVLASCHPHPDLGKPRLWSLGAKDHAVSLIPWPLPLAKDLPAIEATPAPTPATDNVVTFGGRP
ncbi:ATP-binding protein [uncultured Brevundimonas sp.]|uniref:ATP-binding protein n=1 Tax=uncultured Brevundimonas sp. TaxID=213418 RepID=UPI0025CC4F46|nr:ATP-binding protein [uncultured Brevundimonas sp.]